jgi:membrane protease YdiL (CAAX protease family)
MKNNRFFPHSFWQSIAFIGMFLLFFTVTMFLCTLIGFKEILKSEHYLIVLLIIDLLIFISIFHIVNSVKGSKINYGFRITNLSLIPITILIIFLFEFGLSAFLLGYSTNDNKIIQQNPFNSMFYVLSVLAFAPILEELVFRGFILKGFLQTYSAKKAIVLSAILFGFIHINIAELDVIHILLTILIGLFFGWIYYKTNSLGLTILLHFFGNFFGLMIIYLRFYLSDNNSFVTSIYNEGLNWVFFGLSFFLIYYLVIRLFHKMKL